MKILSYYENLPETMPQESVEKEFKELLVSKGSCDSSDFLECLYEVSSRQVLNYSLIDAHLLQTLNRLIIDEWDKNSIESTENSLAIILNLGLQSAWDEMLGKINSIDSKEVSAEIMETHKEVGDCIEDVSNIG